MTKEEFEEIIKPLWLIDNKTHREFLMQSITGNFNRWNESKVKNLSSNTVLGEVFNQKVRIRPRISTGKFQGRYTKENQEWLEKNEGKIINAIRDGLNYYKLENGFICHIYECSDVS